MRELTPSGPEFCFHPQILPHRMKLRPQSQPYNLKQTFGGIPDKDEPSTNSNTPLWKQSSRDFIKRSKMQTKAPGNGPHFDESLGRYSAWPAGTSEWYRSINNNVNERPTSKAARHNTRSMDNNNNDRPGSRAIRHMIMKEKLDKMDRAVSRPSRSKAPLWKTASHPNLSRKSTRTPGNGPHKDESLGGTVYRGNAGTSDWYKSINNNTRPRTGAEMERKAVHTEWIHL